MRTTTAGTWRLRGTLAAQLRLLAVVSVLFVAGCSRDCAPVPVLASGCLPLAGGRDARITIHSPGSGTLAVRIEEQGISVVASLEGDPRSEASSPLDRFGTLALVAGTRPGQTHSIQVRTEDSPDIAGTFCYRASLHRNAASASAQAEQSLAAAGRAVHTQDWEGAFGSYAQAARRFDGSGLWRSAATTRQAMAEIAYRRVYRLRDSYALAVTAWEDYQKEPNQESSAGTGASGLNRVRMGLLAEVEAKDRIEAPGGDVHLNAPDIRKLLSVAHQYAEQSGVGARELPRIDIMSGFLEYMMDQPVRTHELFTSAAQRCHELRDWDCYAIAKQNLALMAGESNNYPAALSAYADVLRVLPPDLDPKVYADIWNNYGEVQGTVGLFSSSERSHARAMGVYARLGDCFGVRRSLYVSGNLMVQLGTLSDAMDNLQRAASAECHDLLSGDPRSTHANRLTNRSHPCAGSLDPRTLIIDNKVTVFNALLSLGDALMLEGEPPLAQECYISAEHYAATARTQLRLANARGTMLLDSNEPARALAEFQHSLEIADQGNIPATYWHRGEAQLGIVKATLLAGKPARSVDAGYQALESSIGRGDLVQTVTALRLLSAGLLQSQRPAEAAKTLQTAADLTQAVPIDELDGEKRAIYLSTQYNVFEDLMDLYASQASADAVDLAFAISEEGRARSLRYAINQTTRDASALEVPPAARYQQLLRDVVNLTDGQSDPEGASLVAHLDAAALREHHGEQPIDPAQLNRTLRQLNATLIEYAAGDRDMFAFVVSDAGTHMVRLGAKQQITAAAAELQDRLRDSETPPEEVRTAAADLAKRVLWPLSQALGSSAELKRLIFVPDGALHTIPFSVLPWSSNLSDRLVVNHAEVSIVPSALFLTRLHAMRRTHTTAPRIRLIGDPVFRVADWSHKCSETRDPRPIVTQAVRGFADWTESLPRLPGSRAEVEMIAQLARQSRPGSQIETFLGCAAVPSALRAASEHADLLHLATHARVDSQRPRLSALALTPESAHEAAGGSTFGLLDILSLKLNSSLVVLSACDTSRGRLLPGEGVLGPAQAFLQSGAAAVVASYWKVDDQATARFMQQFYRHLLLEHLPAAAALRKAQLDQSDSAPNHDWAAFALYGWPDADL